MRAEAKYARGKVVSNLTVCQMKENHSEDFHQAGIHLFRDGIASVEGE